ncbi:MAG: hypothetical protein NTX28_10155 [Novosphingobium sp.]|nr:hypothetical protein [Novosphingobium sp.]
MKRHAPSRRGTGKLVRSQLQITPELQAFARDNYPIPEGVKVWQAFAWSDTAGYRRRVRFYCDDGLQIDGTFSAARADGTGLMVQYIGNFRMKWNLIARKEPA